MCVCVCVCVRARTHSVLWKIKFTWGLCVVCDEQHSGRTCYILRNRICKQQISVTHCSWHTRQDAATTQWPYGILMLCCQAVYCALLPVWLFFFCSWCREIETLTCVTRDLQIHRKSSICFCHPWKTDRPDIIHRKIHETDNSGGAPHWTVIVHLFWICIDTWLRCIMFAAQVLVLIGYQCVVMCVDINEWHWQVCASGCVCKLQVMAQL